MKRKTVLKFNDPRFLDIKERLQKFILEMETEFCSADERVVKFSVDFGTEVEIHSISTSNKQSSLCRTTP